MNLKLPARADELVCLRDADRKHDYWTSPGRYVRLAPLVVIRRSVFEEQPPWEKELLRGVAAARNSLTAVLTGRHAARLWGVSVHSPDASAYRRPVTMVPPGTAQRTSRRNWPPHVTILGTVLHDEEHSVHQGIRIVTRWRAVRDVILHDPDPLAGLVALESLRHQAGNRDADCVARVLGLRRYRSKGTVRSLVSRSVADSGSALETWGRYLLEEADLPEISSIKPQVLFRVKGRRFYVDLLINNWLIIEFDGSVKYLGADAGLNLRKEADRQHDLLNTGRPMIRVSHADLANGRFVPMVVEALRNYPRPA